MTKKLLVVAMALVASLFLATSAFAAAPAPICNTATTAFNAVGSSAQFNTLAAAAIGLIGPGYNLISMKSTPWSPTITDGVGGGLTDSATLWIAFDNNTGNCNVYMYWSVDSGVGVKDFFRYTTHLQSTHTANKYSSVANALGTITDSGAAATCQAKVAGVADTFCTAYPGDDLPTSVVAAVNYNPASQIDGTVSTKIATAQPYCGNVSSISGKSQFFCYFNAAATDIRPEDALFAVTRGLAAYNGYAYGSGVGSVNGKPVKNDGSNGQLTGLGYGPVGTDVAACTSGLVTGVGCKIYDSFNQNSHFNVVNFKLSGTDPFASSAGGGGTLPLYTTLSVGVAPVAIIVSDQDTKDSLSFGKKSTTNDPYGNKIYNFHDINSAVIPQIFGNWSHCTGDLVNSGSGSGHPIQVVHREPLSGTYNTFEFTGVRTIKGGSNPFISVGTTPPGPPISNTWNGQEEFNDPAVQTFDYSNSSTSTGCTFAGSVANGYPQAACFDPLVLLPPTGTACASDSTGTAGAFRAIGTGEEVPAIAGTYNTTSSGIETIGDGIGYSFWGYGNLNPLCSSVTGTVCTGSYLGHYLTVDGIDPLFTTAGGEGDPTSSLNVTPFNFPVCDVAHQATCSGGIPFTHIKDGTYPLWSLLRIVTFGTNAGKYGPPSKVLDMLAQEEEAAVASPNVQDFVPFFTGISGSNGSYTGNLNVYVFRSHYTQSSVKPSNGHSACGGSFTGVSIQGGRAGAATCLVDFGGDVGGSVLTVQKDLDYITDFGTEEYGLKQ